MTENGQQHMSEDDDFMDTEEQIPRDIEKEAEDEKNTGNNFYKQKDYFKAIKFYTNAINLMPEKAAYYGNRAAAYMMISNFSSALDDSLKSVEKDPNFFKGGLRMIKCYIALGNLTAASRSLQDLKSRDPNNSSSYASETTNINRLKDLEISADKDMNNNDYRKVVYVMDRALEMAPACVNYKTKRAECLALLGRYNEAQEAANEMLRANNLNAGALYVKGLCLFYQDHLDKARQHFLQVLRVDPDHSKARLAVKDVKELESTKQKGNAAFTSGNNEEALKLYRAALLICPNNRLTNAKLHANIAAVYMKLRNYEEAAKECTAAVKLDEGYIKAYARRIVCYQELDKHDEAVRDAEKLHKMEHSRESKQRLRDANIKLKMSKRKDYYKILGCSKSATEEEIKKAYKRAALKHHPDRHSHGTDEERAAAEKQFKEIGEAYSVLSDANKKMRYDNGEDLDDPHGGMHDVDPTQIFQTFFGGGGGGGPHQQFFSGGFPHGHGGRGGNPGFTFSFG
ncbi:hypothetical protein ACHWQZ_G008819 [Mnemiopsis leidyi]